MKILLYTDLAVRPDELFWHRDLGLLTKAFRGLGHDAWLVVHPASESASKIKNQKSKIANDPVIWASPADVRNPKWWQHHHPDLIILGLWTRPQYDVVRRAALAATPRVVERADSDGIRTASCGLRLYGWRRYDYFRDRTSRWPLFASIPASVLYSCASILATPWIEARLARTLKLLPALAVEMTQAMQLWKALADRLGADPSRIQCIPHPIQTHFFHGESSIPKKNQILSVGRWESYQKNYPLLLKTLQTFLQKSPGWTAHVIGSGLPKGSPDSRISFSAPLPARQLARQMQASKIFLCASRYESFGLAAAEAAACGCAVVSAKSCLSATGVVQPNLGETLTDALCRCRESLLKGPCPADFGKAVPAQVAGDFMKIFYPRVF